MTEREDNVYKAKLTEQAERYDGNLSVTLTLTLTLTLLTLNCRPVMTSASPQARILPFA